MNESGNLMKFAYLIEPPFNYRDINGQVSGCDIELARHIFQALDIVDFGFIETEFAKLLPGLASQHWRITTGLFATEERCKNATFSRPVWALCDGFLVKSGNPLALTGYQGAADNDTCLIAVIKDQIQHRSALDFGVPQTRIKIFETYKHAALAVHEGKADAYISVAKAHRGFLEQNPDFNCEVVNVPISEKKPGYGCFGFSLADQTFLQEVNNVLDAFIGTKAHRDMMSRFGFSANDIDLLV